MKRALLNSVCPYTLYRSMPRMTVNSLSTVLALAYGELRLTHVG